MTGMETLRAAQDAATGNRFDDALALARRALQLGLDLDAPPSELSVDPTNASTADALARVRGRLANRDEAAGRGA